MALPIVFPTVPGLATLVGSSCPLPWRQPVCTQLFLFEGLSIYSLSSAGIWIGAVDAQRLAEAENTCLGIPQK